LGDVVYNVLGFLPIVVLLSFSTIASGYAQNSFHVDVKLLKDKTLGSDIWFKFPDHGLDVSNSSSVCPSANCKVTENDLTFVLDEKNNFMDVLGDFQLNDDITNGHFGPKKQNLVEEMSAHFPCHFTDIQEVANNVKYICSDGKGDLRRAYNSTHYQYRFAASFELPSQRYILNATHTNERLMIFLDGGPSK
jgi:hypothetical protein